ncbi:MAG TPA: sigma-70 family RNA polymerase sigma factor [Solirubrobacter sp.]|nr:sigma-70 family RNA polymerase sigma factor [Solirubrobacter sp.]
MEAVCDGPPDARLSLEEERELVRAAQAGDRAARDRLIDAFMPLVAGMSRIYRGYPAVDRGELMQEGVVGLLRAIRRYDLEQGTPFWAYASWWVRQAMQQLVAELTRPVVLSDRAARQLARVKDARREHLQVRGKEPSLRELADETQLPRRQVESLVVAERSARGLEEPIRGDEGVVGTFGDLLADPHAEAAFERVPYRLEVERALRLLDGLSERERTILQGRFGLDCAELTLRELAERLGVSAERVRQIEERALSRLRDAVDSEPDRPRHRLR